MFILLDIDPSRQVQGINYLKKAADQGHELALEYLAACYRMRRGINASNESDIRKFLDLTPAERTARRAAQELFNSLSNGNEYVTVEQLEKRMREIYKIQKKTKKSDDGRLYENSEILQKGDVDEACSSSSSPLRVQSSRRSQIEDNENHISEANLLSAAHSYSNGMIPSVNQALTLSVPHPQTLAHVPYFHRPFFHPTMFFSILYHRFLKLLSTFPTESIKQYQVLIVLIVYGLVSSNNIFISLPTFVFYMTLVIMVVSSFKVMSSKHEFIDFRIWSGLFLSYNEHVYADDSENLFLRNNLKPYLWFFIAFLTNLTIYPYITDQWLPNSEITVLSFMLIFITMFCFMYTSSRSLDFTILFSFALNVLAKYPYEMDSIVSSKWRFLDLKIPGIPSFMIGSGIEFSMNCRGMLYLGIVLFLLMLMKRNHWRGIYQHLLPHFMTLAWLQICIINSETATTFGLIRSALGLAGIFFFLPIFGLATLLIPVFAATEWLSVSDTTNKIFITISTSLLAILGSCFLAISNRTGKYVTFIHILVCVLASGFLFRPYMMLSEQSNLYSSYLQEATGSKIITTSTIESLDSETLSWEMYHKYCLSSSYPNKLNTQLRCAQLDGSKVYWEGTITEVEISSIRNWRKDLILNFLPEMVGNFVMCYFGELNQANCYNGENCEEIKDFIETQRRCNVDKWNVYDYDIEVKMTTTSSSGLLTLNPRHETKITLRASHAFGNFTSQINSSDKIWFKGTINTLFSTNQANLLTCKHNHQTRIELISIGCHHCTEKTLASFSIVTDFNLERYFKDFQRGLKYLLNALFNPLVRFK